MSLVAMETEGVSTVYCFMMASINAAPTFQRQHTHDETSSQTCRHSIQAHRWPELQLTPHLRPSAIFALSHTLTHIHTRMHWCAGHSCVPHNRQLECRLETRHSSVMRQWRRCQIPVTSGKAGGPVSSVLHLRSPTPPAPRPRRMSGTTGH